MFIHVRMYRHCIRCTADYIPFLCIPLILTDTISHLFSVRYFFAISATSLVILLFSTVAYVACRSHWPHSLCFSSSRNPDTLCRCHRQAQLPSALYATATASAFN
jgi:hypothetical protein